MHKTACFAALALSLFGVGPVSAQSVPPQEPSAAQATQQSVPGQPQPDGKTTAPDHTVPPPPHAQPQAPLADLAKPAAVGPAQANTAGSIASETPPGATGQTMPSTISKSNAALDKLPTTALQFPLTEAQKQLIAKSVATTPKSQATAELANIHVAMFLPTHVPIHEFSSEVAQRFPPASRYKYVRLNDRVLIVDPPNLTVVGEIML